MFGLTGRHEDLMMIAWIISGITFGFFVARKTERKISTYITSMIGCSIFGFIAWPWYWLFCLLLICYGKTRKIINPEAHASKREIRLASYSFAFISFIVVGEFFKRLMDIGGSS